MALIRKLKLHASLPPLAAHAFLSVLTNYDIFIIRRMTKNLNIKAKLPVYSGSS